VALEGGVVLKEEVPLGVGEEAGLNGVVRLYVFQGNSQHFRTPAFRLALPHLPKTIDYE
jgi:hypothetical protein